jgi:hypothetical protein
MQDHRGACPTRIAWMARRRELHQHDQEQVRLNEKIRAVRMREAGRQKRGVQQPGRDGSRAAHHAQQHQQSGPHVDQEQRVQGQRR